MKTESRLTIAWGWDGVMAKRYGVSSGDNEHSGRLPVQSDMCQRASGSG